MSNNKKIPKPSSRKSSTELNISYAIRSFVGYLQGTEKAEHTVKNYRSDLASFQEFLQRGLSSNPVGLKEVTRADLESYHDYLKSQGLKNNTRRRKILTVRKLLGYLTKRNKMSLDVGRKLPAPHKVERVPWIVPSVELVTSIQELSVENELQGRNRVLLWSLAETGAQVSEVAKLRFEDWSKQGDQGWVKVGAKSPRSVPVSLALYAAVMDLKQSLKKESPWVFLGFNKFGSLGSAISPRGVELLVKVYAGRLGYPKLTPRTFRHSAVLHWYQSGLKKDEIQKRLGLKTDYAFRVYEPLFKSSLAATSTSETPQGRS